MIDPTNIRSLDVPRSLAAVLLILAASAAVGEVLLLALRAATRGLRAVAARFRFRHR